MESITAVEGHGRARRPIARLVAMVVAAVTAVTLMPGAAVASSPVPAAYVPIAPVRLLDTRVGNGLSAKLSANVPATFQVTGRGGIPAGATAVTGNVTVVNSASSWAVYLGPDPIANPTSSTINFSAGQIIANGLTVALSSAGTLSATYMGPSGNTTDLVFDVSGYYTPDWHAYRVDPDLWSYCATGTGADCSVYFPVTPTRILDTRVGLGLPHHLSANVPATFQISGLLSGESLYATAVTGNLTVVNSTSSWADYLGPDPVANPTSSTINFGAGQIIANGVTVALGSGGTLSATFMGPAGATTDLVFDVTGFFGNLYGY